MKREIKFRAYSKETGKMMDWEFIKSVKNLHKLLGLNHVVVQQYTGLKDKNGVEVYDGDVDENNDVVMWCDNRSGWTLNVYDFKSKERIFCHCLECEGNFDINDVSFEVIGKIHDK